MSRTREEPRQGPPLVVVILVAIFMIALLMELGAAWWAAKVASDVGSSGSATLIHSSDAATIARHARGTAACASQI